MARAFVFPGQGSQAVGMGVSLAEAFPAARELFATLDEKQKDAAEDVLPGLGGFGARAGGGFGSGMMHGWGRGGPGWR